jgi:hypothetical protein
MYAKDADGEYFCVDGEYVQHKLPTDGVCIMMNGLATMLRVITLHGGPPEPLVMTFAPPQQQIMQDSARLPAYLA